MSEGELYSRTCRRSQEEKKQRIGSATCFVQRASEELHWCSVHAFCKRDRDTLLLPNLINRYSIGDRTKGVPKDTEGRVDDLHQEAMDRAGTDETGPARASPAGVVQIILNDVGYPAGESVQRRWLMDGTPVESW